MNFYSGDFTDGVRAVDVNFRKEFKVAGQDGTLQLLWKNLRGPYYDIEEKTVSKRAVYLTLKMDI